jgi:hypothetical protein
MSLSAIASAASNALPTVNFHPHGHRKGARPDTGSTSSTSATSSASSGTSAMSIGQLPVGATTPLFNNILQSLTQTVAAQTAVTAATPAGATTAAAGTTGAASATSTTPATGTTNTAANVQAFMHSLFQALKQDGLGGSANSGAVSAATSAAGTTAAGTTAAGSGQYQGNLVSSLQSLVQQVGNSSSAATTNLSAAYRNLVNAAGSGTAATSAASAGASSNQSSSAGLQNFLNNLLQNLQSGGVHSLSSIGNNVNANV